MILDTRKTRSRSRSPNYACHSSCPLASNLLPGASWILFIVHGSNWRAGASRATGTIFHPWTGEATYRMFYVFLNIRRLQLAGLRVVRGRLALHGYSCWQLYLLRASARSDLVARISIISRRCHTVMFYVILNTRKSNFAMRVNNTRARTFHAAAARSQ